MEQDDTPSLSRAEIDAILAELARVEEQSVDRREYAERVERKRLELLQTEAPDIFDKVMMQRSVTLKIKKLEESHDEAQKVRTGKSEGGSDIVIEVPNLIEEVEIQVPAPSTTGIYDPNATRTITVKVPMMPGDVPFRKAVLLAVRFNTSTTAPHDRWMYWLLPLDTDIGITLEQVFRNDPVENGQWFDHLYPDAVSPAAPYLTWLFKEGRSGGAQYALLPSGQIRRCSIVRVIEVHSRLHIVGGPAFQVPRNQPLKYAPDEPLKYAPDELNQCYIREVAIDAQESKHQFYLLSIPGFYTETAIRNMEAEGTWHGLPLAEQLTLQNSSMIDIVNAFKTPGNPVYEWLHTKGQSRRIPDKMTESPLWVASCDVKAVDHAMLVRPIAVLQPRRMNFDEQIQDIFSSMTTRSKEQ